jgi:signal transduction histidine kinase
MHESSSVPSAPAVELQSPSAAANGSAAGRAADPPEMTIRLAMEHDRIVEGLNNDVVHRLFSAGLALEAALALAGSHPAAAKIEQAIGELDQAINDLRAAVFTRPRPAPRVAAGPG